MRILVQLWRLGRGAGKAASLLSITMAKLMYDHRKRPEEERGHYAYFVNQEVPEHREGAVSEGQGERKSHGAKTYSA